MDQNGSSRRLLSRRDTLKFIGVAGAASVAGWRLGIIGPSRSDGGDRVALAETFDCVAKPALTEGPYFVDERLNRSDIRSDPMTGAIRNGVALGLAFNVHRLEAGACSPLAGAFVDVWHCDAGGVYSGFAGQLGGVDTTGQTFMRGSQLTGNDGRVKFFTIYPGWYQGRTPHIHLKVHVGGDVVHTGQLFMSERITAALTGDMQRSTPTGSVTLKLGTQVKEIIAAAATLRDEARLPIKVVPSSPHPRPLSCKGRGEVCGRQIRRYENCDAAG